LASPPDFDGIRTPFLYDSHAWQLIHRLKYNNARAYAGRMAELLAEFMAANDWEADVVVPVPLHSRRERARGYNHSELLARDLGRHTGIAVVTSALTRTKDTSPQVSLPRAEQRRRNVQGAFECRLDMGGRNVLLVDDVVTTGATMSACAKALKRAGAGSVWGLAFARNAPPA
jgi:ComF family protein